MKTAQNERTTTPRGRGPRATTAALAAMGLLLGTPPIRAQAGAEPPVSTSERVADTTVEVFESVGPEIQDNVNRAMRQAELAIARAADVGKSVAIRLTSGGLPRSLVLPGADMKGEDVDRLTEDLGVMSRILEKAVGRAPEGRSYFAGVFGGGAGRNPDAYYLDGFGALFLLRVDFPLAAPVEAKAEEGPAATDRTWEATRRELREGTAGDPPIWDVLGARAFHGEFPEYDGGRVGELRGALVQSLRHASNLAVLKPEETVAVTVFGPPAGREDRPVKAGKRRGTGAGAGDGPEDDAAKGTTLTLRARKADIDAFAGGKLTPEEFAKRVRETLR